MWRFFRACVGLGCCVSASYVLGDMLYKNPLGIIDKVSPATYFWVHFQVHHTLWLPVLGLYLIGVILVVYHPPKTKPNSMKVALEGFAEAFNGMIQVQDETGNWRTIPAYQISEFLNDEQLKKVRELEEWMKAQDPQTEAEVEAAQQEFTRRRKEVVVIRPAQESRRSGEDE